MSGFIVRDYLSPARTIQANRIAIKTLYKQVLGTTVIDGIPVLNRRMYIYGTYFTAIKDGVRYDNKFNRLMSKLGMHHEDLVNSDYGKVQDVYMYLDQNKIKFTPQDAIDLAQKFNAYYELNKYVPATETVPASGREYLDVRITVGGEYRNAVYVNNVELTLEAANLPTVRAEVESKLDQYLMGGNRGITGVPDIYTKTGSLLAPTVGIEYNEDAGNLYDIISVLDNGELYEIVNPCMNEKFSVTEISNSGSTTGMTYNSGEYRSNYLNMEYTYTKRYRLKRYATEHDATILKLKELSDSLNTILTTPVEEFADILLKKAYTANNDLLTELLYDINDDGADSADFYKDHLRLDAFEAMKPSEFVKLIDDCLELGFTKKKGKWWKKALAVIIVIIAIIIAVIVTIYSLGTQTGTGVAIVSAAIAYGAAAAGLFLALAGMVYAKHVGDEWGMKVIGGAAQTASVIGSIAGITAVYMQPTITALQAANATLAAVNLAVQLGVIDIGTKEQRALAIATAGGQLAQGLNDFWTDTGSFSKGADDSLSKIACRNVSGFMDNLGNGLQIAAMVGQWNAGSPNQVTEDQAVKEDGVSAVYVMQEKAYKNDMLELLEEQKYLAYGINATDKVKQVAYGV